VPLYYRRLDQTLVDTSWYQELPLWQKDFKQMWQKLEKRPITLPLNDAYKPDVMKWVCTCPAFVTNRFLICKHLIQGVHHNPPLFFVKVKRNQTVPFWRHGLLKVLDPTAATIEEQLQSTDGDSSLMKQTLVAAMMTMEMTMTTTTPWTFSACKNRAV
jgi:hypothetical protein